MTILVIEDNTADFILLKECLIHQEDEQPVALHHARTMKEALSFSLEHNADVVFLDLSLPDSNGLESFLSVTGIFPFATIIVVSGNEDKNVALQAIQAGAQDFILKSDFDAKLLKKTLQYSIERRQTQLKLKEVNLRYELVSKATNDPLWDWDLTSGKIIWNEMVDIFGYSPALEKNENWWNENIHPDDKEQVLQTLRQQLNENSYTWNAQYRFRCYNGSYKHILDRGYIVRDRKGNPIRIIGTMEDITERVLLQEQLNSQIADNQLELLKATLAGQEKEKNQVGKELHDNINQVLATIKMYLGIAASDKERSAEMVAICAEHIEIVISEIRKLTHTLVAPSLGDISLADALKQLTDDFRRANLVEVELNTNLPADIADPSRKLTLFRVVQEQLSNIQKYAKASAVFISLIEKNGAQMLLIKDNGVGFDPGNLKKGIGFANMQSRINIHKGELKITAAPGQGCSIDVFLPELKNKEHEKNNHRSNGRSQNDQGNVAATVPGQR